jgi:integrase
MLSAKVKLTKAVVEATVLPPNGRAWFRDSLVAGFQLLVTPSGSRSFYVRRKRQGKSSRIFLGRYPDMSVENARKAAQELIGAIAAGAEPQSLMKSRSGDLATLGDLMTDFLVLAKQHKKTWREDQAQFVRYLSGWKNRTLKSVTRQDVTALHALIGRKSGPYAANRLLALLSRLFNHARSIGAWEGENPIQGIKRFKESGRVRFLGPSEMPQFLAALEREPNVQVRHFFLLALLTGQRRGNVLSMRWDQIDFTRREWNIPDTKNGTPHTVPLVGRAYEILASWQTRASGEFVFPGLGRAGHMVEPSKAWRRILARAGLRDFRIHDLRHTLATWQAGTGASLPIIGKTLNHKTAAATQRYAHLFTSPVRSAIESAADAMFGCSI